MNQSHEIKVIDHIVENSNLNHVLNLNLTPWYEY